MQKLLIPIKVGKSTVPKLVFTNNSFIRGHVKEEFLVIILGFSPFLHKNICCGYSLEAPHRGTYNEWPQHVFMEKKEN